jgi:hypothetical protein
MDKAGVCQIDTTLETTTVTNNSTEFLNSSTQSLNSSTQFLNSSTQFYWYLNYQNFRNILMTIKYCFDLRKFHLKHFENLNNECECKL